MILFGSEDNGAHRYIESFLKMCPDINKYIVIPNDPVSYFNSYGKMKIETIVTGSSIGDDTIDKQLWRLALFSKIKSIAKT